jgi:hypothetical protein
VRELWVCRHAPIFDGLNVEAQTVSLPIDS